MEQHKNIASLLARFFDGATTLAEERELQAFFSSENVPEEWARYREMFAWYGTGLSEGKPVLRPRKRRLGLWGSVAAAIVGVVLLLRPGTNGKPQTYVESYIIRDGVMITDPAIVNAALEESRLYWEEVEREQTALALQMEIALREPEFEWEIR
jgi:hypothetical protein